jgi:competence protein ComEC
MSGLTRLHKQEGFDYLWDTENTKTLDTDGDFGPRFDPEDWGKYQNIRNENTSTKVISPERGSSGQFWDDDNIEIVHPTADYVESVNDENEDYSDENQVFNDLSYVLKMTHGNQSVLLCGDVMKHAWNDIIDDKGLGFFEDVTVLKASHHGRKSGFHQEVVEAMDPDYVILSVGAKPDTDAHQQYKSACGDDTEVLSTRQHGTITALCTQRRCIINKKVPDGIF